MRAHDGRPLTGGDLIRSSPEVIYYLFFWRVKRVERLRAAARQLQYLERTPDRRRLLE
jgi:hypothetical protein